MNNNYQNVRIHIHNQEEKLAALEFLSKMSGLPINVIVLEETKQNENIAKFNYVNISDGEVGANMEMGNADIFEFSNIHTLLTRTESVSISVKLSDGYTAVVKKSGVVVGCQKFSWDAMDRLFKAIKKVRESV
jgi:hypothetical protein